MSGRKYRPFYLFLYQQNCAIGIMVRESADGFVDCGPVRGRVKVNTQKMVLDASLLNTKHHNVLIKGKVKQSREWSSFLPYALVL